MATMNGPSKLAALLFTYVLGGSAYSSTISRDCERNGGCSKTTRVHLALLFDIQGRRVEDERTVGPSDLAGVIEISRIRITRDGRILAFDYARRSKYLFLVNGLLLQQ